jgi:hypothetical protein
MPNQLRASDILVKISEILLTDIPVAKTERVKSFIQDIFEEMISKANISSVELKISSNDPNDFDILYVGLFTPKVTEETIKERDYCVSRLSRTLSQVSFLKTYGWHIRQQSRSTITLEPVRPDVTAKVPRYIYHSTTPSQLDDILKEGLIPIISVGSNSWHHFSYPPRIFFTTSPEMLKTVLLRIDTHKLTNVTFYSDSFWNLGTGIWTDSPIPPKAIEIYRNEE